MSEKLEKLYDLLAKSVHIFVFFVLWWLIIYSFMGAVEWILARLSLINPTHNFFLLITISVPIAMYMAVRTVRELF